MVINFRPYFTKHKQKFPLELYVKYRIKVWALSVSPPNMSLILHNRKENVELCPSVDMPSASFSPEKGEYFWENSLNQISFLSRA